MARPVLVIILVSLSSLALALTLTLAIVGSHAKFARLHAVGIGIITYHSISLVDATEIVHIVVVVVVVDDAVAISTKLADAFGRGGGEGARGCLRRALACRGSAPIRIFRVEVLD